MREGLCDARGKRRDEVEVGKVEASTITQPRSHIDAEAAWDHTEEWDDAKHRPKVG